MERVRTWMRHRLREPRFDSSTSAMPKSGLSERKAKIVVDFLLEGRGNETIAAEAEDQGEAAMPKRAPGRSPLMLVAAFGLGVVATLLAGVALRRRGPRG